MSNVFSIQEIKNREILVPLDAPGIARLLKGGARVKIRSDLVEGKVYNGIKCLRNMAEKRGEILRVKDGNLFYYKNLFLENGYYYSLEMLEGVYLN